MHTLLVIGGVILAIAVVILVIRILMKLEDARTSVEVFTWRLKRAVLPAVILVIVVIVIITMISK